MKTERKIYIVPQCDCVDFEPLSIIATSPLLGVVGDEDKRGSEVDGSGFTEDAGAVRGDWEHIWDGM